MGIPKYLEEKIKSIIHCCIAAIQAAITPNTSTFLLRRPNDEPFIIDGPNSDQATVGMADYALVDTPILTGRQYNGNDVYEARFETILSTTGGTVTLATGIDRLFEADLVFLSAGDQYYLNGTIDTVCDAHVIVDGTTLKLVWTTAHIDDRVYSIVRFTYD
jgi:hypothetical protein